MKLEWDRFYTQMRVACLSVACNQDMLLLPSECCQTWLRRSLSCLLLEVSQDPGEALLKLDLILHFSRLCFCQNQLCRMEFCFDLTQSLFKIILINWGIGQENIAGHFNWVWSNDQLRIHPFSNILQFFKKSSTNLLTGLSCFLPHQKQLYLLLFLSLKSQKTKLGGSCTAVKWKEMKKVQFILLFHCK